MTPVRWIVALVMLVGLAAAPAVAQEHPPGEPAGASDTASLSGEARTTAYLEGMVDHTQDHGLDHQRNTGQVIGELTMHRIMMLVSAALVTVIFLWLAFRRREGSPIPRGKLENLIDTVIIYIRDEIVRPSIHGPTADKLLPLFVTFFFFILACNLLGMIPAPGGGTPTANIGVTAALAIVVFVVGLGGGMIVQGPGPYWKNLVPHGLPLPLVPFIFVIEVVGLCTKHFALAIRLFANMLAGHIVLAAIVGLIFIFGSVAVVPAVGLAVCISMLETFVAFLQAYVFTLLSALFIGMALHPDH